MGKITIGIDPGVHTGVAVYNCTIQSFLHISSTNIVEAQAIVQQYAQEADNDVVIILEDPRLIRRRANMTSALRMRGVGSVMRDASMWCEWARHNNIPLYRKGLGITAKGRQGAEMFKQLTGITRRTNSHERDAAMIALHMSVTDHSIIKQFAHEQKNRKGK